MVAHIARNSAFVATYLSLASATLSFAQELQSQIVIPPVICEVSMDKSAQDVSQESLQIVKFSNPEQQRVVQRLKDPISVKFHSTPLVDAIRQIQKESGINFAIDEREIGSDLKEQVVDFELSGISLQSALKIILEKYDYGYVFSNDILSVTTQEIAESKTYIRLYDIASLEPEVFRAIFVVVDDVKISDSFESVIIEGPDGFKMIFLGEDTLIIRAKLEIHREIEDILRQLVRKEAKTPQTLPRSPGEQQADVEPALESKDYSSYLGEPSAFEELDWGLPSLDAPSSKNRPNESEYPPLQLDGHAFDWSSASSISIF